jgi:hypothetical protein
MSTFSINITALLEEYKTILRKLLPLKEANAKIYRLKLVNKQLSQISDDIVLYKIANNVINDAQKLTKDFTNNQSYYFRLFDYAEHLKRTLNDFCIENDKVIHPKQEASRKLLEAIQLIGLSPKLNSTFLERLKGCVEIINKYGTEDQYQQLMMLIKSKSNEEGVEVNAYLPIISAMQFTTATKKQPAKERI